MENIQMIDFRIEQKCEICGGSGVRSLSHSYVNGFEGSWLFTCAKCEAHRYDIPLDELFGGSWKAVDWLAHISSKPWFDAADFFAAIRRLRKGL